MKVLRTGRSFTASSRDRTLHAFSGAPAALALCGALTACATPTPQPVTPATVTICIPLGNVTPAQQKGAEDVLSGLSAEQQAALLPIIADWIAMRDADRACIKGSSQ